MWAETAAVPDAVHRRGRARGRAVRLAAYALLLAALWPLHLRLIEYAFDDAYIHIRIAEHLLRDGEPYFNFGDPVMASSSPLWTVILTALLALSGSSLAVVAAANAVLTTLCAWVYGELTRRVASTVSGAVADALAALVVVPLLAGPSIGLMETPLAVLLVGAGMLLVHDRHPAGAACLTLAVFARVELAAVFLAFASAAVAWKHLRAGDVLRWSAGAALPMVAYELYFYGSVIPSAVRAKSVGYDPTMSEVLGHVVPRAASGPAAPMLVAVFVLAVAVGALAVLRRPVPPIARLSFVAGLAIAVVYVGTGALVFEWYLPLYTVALAWPMLAAALDPATGSLSVVSRRLAGLGALALFIWPAFVGFAGYVRGAVVNPAYAPGFLQGARVRRYIEVGRTLFASFPDQVLLTSEVGGLAFAFDGRVEDGFGLVSPEAVKHHPMAVPQARSSGTLGAIPAAYVDEINPALVVSYDIFVEEFLHSSAASRYVRLNVPPFQSRDVDLAKAAGISTSLWGIRTLHVFIKRDVPAGDAELLQLRSDEAGETGRISDSGTR